MLLKPTVYFCLLLFTFLYIFHVYISFQQKTSFSFKSSKFPAVDNNDENWKTLTKQVVENDDENWKTLKNQVVENDDGNWKTLTKQVVENDDKYWKTFKNQEAKNNYENFKTFKNQNEKLNSKANTNILASDVKKKLLELYGNTTVDPDWIDILGQPPIKFIATYKNPCFMGDGTNRLFNDHRLHCLPYFYLIGVRKSGTTDLYFRISAHPEYSQPGGKELHWFDKYRFGFKQNMSEASPLFKKIFKRGIDIQSIQFYISLFDRAATYIQNCSSCITADSTPANLHLHPGWEVMPGNEGLRQPRYTNFHYIKHLTPGAKIIIIFRDPVSRLFSDFMQDMKKRNHHPEKLSEMFHQQATVLTRTYKNCFTSFSMRRCIYNNTLWLNLRKEKITLAYGFRLGFYAFYMRELISVFGRDKILPILMLDYIHKPEETLANVFRFLNMSTLTAEQMSNIVNLTIYNKDSSGARMYKETEEMLYNYYNPFNKEMAKLMKNKAYMFLRK